MTVMHPHVKIVREGEHHHVRCNHADHDQPVLSDKIAVLPIDGIRSFIDAHRHDDDFPPAA